MKEEIKKEYPLTMLIAGVILGILIMGGAYQFIPSEPTIVENNVTVEQPLLIYNLADWGENSNIPDEKLFRGYLYNYGDAEVKNVELTCMSFDGDKRIDSFKENIGNFASLSENYIEVSNKLDVDFKGVTAGCYVTNMSSGISVLKRLPTYEKYF